VVRDQAYAFLSRLRESKRRLFATGQPVYVSRAPGRLDVMGGIADYAGSHVLQATIAEAVFCALQLRRDGLIVITTELPDGRELSAQFRVEDIDNAVQGSYQAVGEHIRRDPSTGWAAYVAGAWAVLRGEGVAHGVLPGATVFLSSSVPIAVGVASSAALEVAAMTALVAALKLAIEPLTLARLCQIVENKVVGAPCGIMDQVAVTLGRENRPVVIHCQPATVLGNLALPEGVLVCGIDSAVEKFTAGDRYRRARVAAFMGRRILAQAAGALPADGHLANLLPAEFRALHHLLPRSIRGADFLRLYGETGDSVTQVHTDWTYPVRGCTEHPVYENHRTLRFIDHLRAAAEGDGASVDHALRLAGRIMYASHWSYTYRCGLGHPAVSRIVQLVREAGPERGVYGAKITGGGGGGTVAILATTAGVDTVRDIARRYAAESGREPVVFVGSSPGAAAHGVSALRV